MSFTFWLVIIKHRFWTTETVKNIQLFTGLLTQTRCKIYFSRVKCLDVCDIIAECFGHRPSERGQNNANSIMQDNYPILYSLHSTLTETLLQDMALRHLMQNFALNLSDHLIWRAESTSAMGSTKLSVITEGFSHNPASGIHRRYLNFLAIVNRSGISGLISDRAFGITNIILLITLKCCFAIPLKRLI